MDGQRFDDFTRTLVRGRLTRRRLLKGAAGGLAAGVAGSAAALLPAPDVAEAACKGLGRTCLFGGQCCSGYCVLVGLPPLRLLQCGCPSGTEPCQGACKGAADYQTDPQHCGGCGQACAAGEVCVDGACQCPTGTELCSGQCVAGCPPGQQVDPTTCGCVCESGGTTCGPNAEICCEPGQGCERNACCSNLHQPCTAFAGPFCCGSQLICVIQAGDPQGTCRGGAGAPCGGDADCSQGAACCGGVCDFLNNQVNCGACGVSCPAGQTCRFEVCVVVNGQPCPAECTPGSACDGCQFGFCGSDGRCTFPL